MTLRQIESISKEIDSQAYDEIKLSAKIQGVQLKFNKPEQSSNIKESDRLEIDKLAQADFDKKRRTWQNKEQTN